jgi:hypothetical protein
VDVVCNSRSASATLVGPAQAAAAAAGASATVRSLMEGEVSEPGAWMPDQVIEPARFFSYLAKHGLIVQQQHWQPTTARSGEDRADQH